MNSSEIAAGAAQREKYVPAAMVRVQNQLERVHKLTDELHSRLTPVLRNEPENAAAGPMENKKGELSSTTPLAGELGTMASQLATACRKIEALITKLEI